MPRRMFPECQRVCPADSKSLLSKGGFAFGDVRPLKGWENLSVESRETRGELEACPGCPKRYGRLASCLQNPK